MIFSHEESLLAEDIRKKIEKNKITIADAIFLPHKPEIVIRALMSVENVFTEKQKQNLIRVVGAQAMKVLSGISCLSSTVDDTLGAAWAALQEDATESEKKKAAAELKEMLDSGRGRENAPSYEVATIKTALRALIAACEGDLDEAAHFSATALNYGWESLHLSVIGQLPTSSQRALMSALYEQLGAIIRVIAGDKM